MKKVSAASIIAAASSLVGEQMHQTKEEVIMSFKRSKPYKYVSPNQYEAWFRKTFLRPRRKKGVKTLHAKNSNNSMISNSWFGATNSILRCPVPGCEHTGSIITKIHCRMAHNMERDEVKKKYGMPLKIDVRKKKEEEIK